MKRHLQHRTRGWRRAWDWAGALALTLLGASPAQAYINDLRITEVDPHHQKIEVVNFNGGLFQLTSELPVTYNFDFYNRFRMGLSPGLVFQNNYHFTFTMPDMTTYAGDCWLYSSPGYDSPSALIHGVQWGTPPPERTASEVAALAGKWPGKGFSALVPPPGCTLAWDGEGYHPLDWYVDATPTMGKANDNETLTPVDDPFGGNNATQKFESSPVGNQVSALKGWTMSAPSGSFSARVVSDVAGAGGPRPGSTSAKWLRIRDTDPQGDNAFSTPALEPGVQKGYRAVFYVNQEVAPTASGAARPALVLQKDTGTNQWADAWGLRFNSDGLDAAVMSGAGTPSTKRLCPLSGATAVGQWVRVELSADLAGGTLLASVNGGVPQRLPINPTTAPLKLRLTYQGGGSGNTQDMLLDDLELAPWDPPQNAAGRWRHYQ